MIQRFVIDIVNRQIVINRYNQYGENHPLVLSINEAKSLLPHWSSWETEIMQNLAKEVAAAIQLIEEEQNAVRS